MHDNTGQTGDGTSYTLPIQDERGIAATTDV